ncbi:MAG TPA: DUF2948 family protein [Dongiaceae bacterium]|nr:DUF2948 family protein [Dongiaceae bacterium]
MTTKTGLKLIARDAEDLAVVASCLQDALVPLNEMRYLGAERRFILVVNRFRWELDNEDGSAPKARGRKQQVDASFEDETYPGAHQRTHSGLCIDRVLAVRSRDIDRDRPDQFLDLLTLNYAEGKLDFIFAGGGVIQLEVEALNLFLQDLGESWPTQWQPQHDAGGIASGQRAKSAELGRK